MSDPQSMLYARQWDEHFDAQARLKRRLQNLARMPIPAKGRDSQRRAQNIIETLTELQNARYIARLNEHG